MSQGQTFEPQPEAQGHSHHAAVPLRVYPSSTGPYLSIAFDDTGTGLFRKGLRLTTDQVMALDALIDEWLEEVRP